MAEMTKYQPGTPSWVDLGTPDPDEASRFYSDLFRWTIEAGPPEAGGYRMCLLDGKAVAGLGPQQNTDVPPYWTTYMTIADVDEIAAAITENGGTIIVAPMDVLDAGRMAVAADPGGTTFSIWQPGIHPGAAIVNEPNTWSWSELMTRDPVRSVEFYGAVFGWEAHLVTAGEDGEANNNSPHNYTEFHLSGRRIAGMLPMEGDTWPADMPNQWVVYFAVDDCEAAVAKIEALGGSVLMPPTVVPPGMFAAVKDPQGAAFNVIAMVAPDT
ncbi:MAG: VOC family protein [Ilumatobacteraceae bacterium]